MLHEMASQALSIPEISSVVNSNGKEMDTAKASCVEYMIEWQTEIFCSINKHKVFSTVFQKFLWCACKPSACACTCVYVSVFRYISVLLFDISSPELEVILVHHFEALICAQRSMDHGSERSLKSHQWGYTRTDFTEVFYWPIFWISAIEWMLQLIKLF